jgi:DNA-directed RNA polymerase specialized sigma24 family protein
VAENVAKPDEVVAEVFLVAWRRLDVVPCDSLPWLLGVARRALANHHRAVLRAAALTTRMKETVVSPVWARGA